MTITRFAPSPTGYLHVGNVRTALFNWLFAKRQGGYMQLRIEDTDQVRSDPYYTDAIISDLAWLGIDWQGADTNTPWQQSQRHPLYEQFFASLRQQQHIYPCFCSPAMLLQERQQQIARKQPPRYTRRCAALSAADVNARLHRGEAAAWRFRMPHSAIDFNDLVRGASHFSGADMSDFIVRRSDGSFSFLFVNALDDALGGISDVLRGCRSYCQYAQTVGIAGCLQLTRPPIWACSVDCQSRRPTTL